jgi:uncharacterized protein
MRAIVDQSLPKSIFQRIVSHPVVLLVVGVFIVLLISAGGGAVFRILLPAPGRSDLVNLGVQILGVASFVGAYWLFVRFVERKPFTDFALSGWAKEWGFGALVGIGAMSATIGVIAALGGYKLVGYNEPLVLIPVLSMALVSGIPEEILLRGLIFRFLEKWLGSAAAIAGSALLFGVAHIFNPNSNWLAAFAIALEAGVLLAAIYMVTRRLWAAIGLHMAWNATQGGIFGVAVSGNDVKGLMVSRPIGSDLISGGAFGAEASLPAIVICTAIGLYFLAKAYRTNQFVRFSWHRFKVGEDAN